MASAGRMAHTTSWGRGFASRVRDNEIHGLAAENIAMGRMDMDQLFARWMASPPHRRNMLDPQFTRFRSGLCGIHKWQCRALLGTGSGELALIAAIALETAASRWHRAIVAVWLQSPVLHDNRNSPSPGSKIVRPFEVTNKLMLAITIPVMLASLTTPLLGSGRYCGDWPAR